MTKYFLSFFLIILLLFCFSQNNPRKIPPSQLQNYNNAEKIFHQAERISSNAGDHESLQVKADQVYRQALEAFNKLIPGADRSANDSLKFFIHLRTGFIEYYFDSITTAKTDYLSAIALKQRLSSIPDSILFIPLLYTGSIYYTQNQFDSALFFYKKAETVNDNYKKPLPGSERLYNRLGVMYYENGNYRQARNYFEKAITLTKPTDISLLINYKINIASLHVKLEEYSEAQTVYESLLPYHVHTDEINHNLGIIALKLKEYKKAIAYLGKVNYPANKKIIELYYDLGEAWSGIQEADSSEFYMEKAVAENTKWNSHKKNIPYGLILDFQAGELVKQHKYQHAIEIFQQAIMQFDGEFTETDFDKNPGEFSGVFSYINLFNALVAKADALELLFREQKDIKFLEYALSAYHAAFKLADYVEKTYDSDEARLFLGKIKYTAHSKPIDVSLLLYDLTQKKEWLEEAYYFDQQNKASILTLNVQEHKLKTRGDMNQVLLEKEASLKTAITRLSLKSMQLTDSLQLQSVTSSIRDNEIQLGKLQEKMSDDPSFRSRYFASQIPGIHELQKKFDNITALLSWHLSANEIVVFIITGNEFTYYKSPIDSNFFKNIDSFKVSLYNGSAEQRFHGAAVSSVLYKTLIGPFATKLSNIERLIIIPDDELNYLPFEALVDENGKWLVEKFSIQYQYSTALLGNNDHSRKKTGTLAFAPFASKGYTDPAGNRFPVLPASKEETNNLPGKTFSDSAASKDNFLSSANHYGIIHLATHASADNEMPFRSFIAFYPSTVINPDNYKLYAGEIYDLKLDSTQLVILSACETGAGKLIKGEGLMSLSRAFAYAGCPNIITSLWKAEDKTTAYLTNKLHAYLDKGYTTDKALQQAKLDLLKSDEIDPRFKTPDCWAHLLFIGNYEPRDSLINWWWIAISIILAALIYIITKKKA